MNEANQNGTNNQERQQQPTIIIQNTNTNTNNNVGGYGGRAKNKWITLLLILCGFGFLGAHKFYEGKIGMGIIYFLTGGVFGIGVLIDFWSTLFKPNPYFV